MCAARYFFRISKVDITVENSVENVQNPDEKGIELGDGQVMRNFTQ